MLVCASNVGSAHKLFASPPYSFRDSRRKVVEDQHVKEEESARNDLALPKSFLGRIAPLPCNLFDAGGGTIVVMVKLM